RADRRSRRRPRRGHRRGGAHPRPPPGRGGRRVGRPAGAGLRGPGRTGCPLQSVRGGWIARAGGAFGPGRPGRSGRRSTDRRRLSGAEHGATVGRVERSIEAATATRVPLRVVEAAGDQSRYLNRELSLLDFNERVLALAEDEQVPVLERAKFLAICSTN